MKSPIHGRYPTTAGCEDFCLLRFRPGPIRPSLDNLVNTTSVELTILTPSLVRTPDRHRATSNRNPTLRSFTNSSFPVTWITEARHNPQLFSADRHFSHIQTYSISMARTYCKGCSKNSSKLSKQIDEDGIRTHAGRAQWISSPSP